MNEKIEKRVVASEDAKLEFLERKVAHIVREKELRTTLSNKRIEPEYEYETTPEWEEHMKQAAALACDEQIILTNDTIDSIFNSRDEREELNRLRDNK